MCSIDIAIYVANFSFCLVLISRWENLLQKLMESVNNSKTFEKLKDESKHLRDVTANLEDTIHSAITDMDLQSQMRKLKVRTKKNIRFCPTNDV